MSQIVFLDSNIIHALPICAAILDLSEHGLFHVGWSEYVLDEVRQSLTHDRGKPLDKVNARITAMQLAFPEAEVTGFENLIERLILPDLKDRHVLAAAIVCGANLIVTNNLRDFPPETLGPHNIQAVSADEFLLAMQDEHPEVGIVVTRRRAAFLTRPQIGIDGILSALERAGAPKYVARLRMFLEI